MTEAIVAGVGAVFLYVLSIVVAFQLGKHEGKCEVQDRLDMARAAKSAVESLEDDL